MPIKADPKNYPERLWLQWAEHQFWVYTDPRQLVDGDECIEYRRASTRCILPVADPDQLRNDELLFGTSFRYHCEFCGREHRLAPENVVIGRRNARADPP